MLLGGTEVNTTSYGLPSWAVLVIGIGLFCVGIYTIIKFLRSAIRVAAAADAIQQALPTLLGIAREFQPNHGTSLHDRLVRLDTVTTNTNDTVTELHSYTHDRIHAIVNALAAVAPTFEIVQRLSAQLGPTPQKLPRKEEP